VCERERERVSERMFFWFWQVFADHASSLQPIVVPRTLLWNLRRRFVFFGTSVTSIFRGLFLWSRIRDVCICLKKYTFTCKCHFPELCLTHQSGICIKPWTLNPKPVWLKQCLLGGCDMSGMTTPEIQACFWRGMFTLLACIICRMCGLVSKHFSPVLGAGFVGVLVGQEFGRGR
jgi:hypothetical protein